MRGALAWATLRRHPARTLLAALGVAVATAMLLDMVMLASGMTTSFRQLLQRQGFEIRLAPRGTLPFDTEATIAGAADAERSVLAIDGVVAVSPVLGATLHVVTGDSAAAIFALGVRPGVQGDYELLEGSDALAGDAIVVNDRFLARTGSSLGDTLDVALGYDPQLRTWAARRRLVITGRGRFLYLAADQAATALPLATLQSMSGGDARDRISLMMLRLAPGANADAVRAQIEREVPRVTAISTADAVATVEERLSYFRQLAVILGTVSLIVGFLLVTTLVTVSVNERVGEIAVMRAIGVSRLHIVQQVLLEGLGIALAGAAAGFLLGLATADYLNTILRSFPGLPDAIDFFVFEPRDAWQALGLLVACAVLAGIFPAWRAASLPIAQTLREEAVG